MKIVNQSEITFEEISEVLRNGGIVIYPTDTCYGIGCDPTNLTAVKKLLEYKVRPQGKPISIAVADKVMARSFVELNENAEVFYDRFLPGAFTIISKSKGNVVSGIESELKTLGVRIPDNKWILDFLKFYKNPITSTSANQSYKKTPYKVDDILEDLSDKSLNLIDLIIDAGELPHNPPSTVIDTTFGDEIHVLRKGSFLPENAKVHEIVSNSEADTIMSGKMLMERFADNLKFRPVIFALQGDLGAGKTQFTKGIAEFFDVSDTVQSPSFILSREYSCSSGNRIFHIDTWRLDDENDFLNLGFDKMLEKGNSDVFNVVVIEWADRVQKFLMELDVNVKVIWVEIIYDKENEMKRLIKWSE